MDYLTEWIKGIILLILLAVVLELLLPNNSLQRYVRLVVGLLLLLALLNPVLSILDADVDEWVEKMTRRPAISGSEMKNTIKNTKREIQASHRAYIEKQVAVQLKNEAEKEVHDRSRLHVAGVDVELMPTGEERPQMTIKWVKVTLSKDDTGNETTADIEPVEPVTIDIDEKTTTDGDTHSHAQEIRRRLADLWRLGENQVIVVIVEGGVEGGKEDSK
ncbi:MAG TPA: stage III sporulation protein AF [Bacillales bacterium]|nr:stage III sporulation protein AF [Bacillales bacterium]